MYTGLQKAVSAILLVFISAGIKAQVPGYMGKKCVVGYGMYANPALAAYLVGYGKSPLNFMNEVYIEAAVAKKIALGAALRFYKTSYGNTRDVDVTDGIHSSSFSQYNSHPSGSTAIKGRDLYFYAKFFKRSYVAPWGRYFILGVAINNYTVKYNPDNMKVYVERGTYYTNTERYFFSDFGAQTQKFHSADLMLGSGKSRVFANRIVIDYGYNINLLGLTLTVLDAPDDAISEDNTTYASEYIKTTSAARIRGINRFNLHFKIGYLF